MSAEPNNSHDPGDAAVAERLHMRPRDSAERLRCARCGDVIGVYEPLLMLAGREALQTSHAAQPDLSPDGEYYHRACYGQRQQDGSSSRLALRKRPARHGPDRHHA